MDGSEVYIELGKPGSVHQLVRIRDGGKKRDVVVSFDPADHGAQILGAAFDGRYLTYSLMRSTTSFDPWILYVWDAQRGGAPKEIARNGGGAKDAALPGPLNIPIVDRGHVFWTQPVAGGAVNLQEYDTATGHVSTVHAGHPARAFRMGRWLVWPESAAPDALATLHAISLDTGAPVELPAVMAGISGAAALDAGDDTLVWINRDRSELYVWRAGWDHPHNVVHGVSGFPFDWPHVAGTMVSWTNIDAQFVLDLRSNTYTQVTPKAGDTQAWGPMLSVGFAPASNAVLPRDVTIVDTRTLAQLPDCSATPPSPGTLGALGAIDMREGAE